MLERVEFFIREIGAIPVADTAARIWSRCLNEINYLKNRKNFLVREGGLRRRSAKRSAPGAPTSSASGRTVAAFDRAPGAVSSFAKRGRGAWDAAVAAKATSER